MSDLTITEWGELMELTYGEWKIIGGIVISVVMVVAAIILERLFPWMNVSLGELLKRWKAR